MIYLEDRKRDSGRLREGMLEIGREPPSIHGFEEITRLGGKIYLDELERRILGPHTGQGIVPILTICRTTLYQ